LNADNRGAGQGLLGSAQQELDLNAARGPSPAHAGAEGARRTDFPIVRRRP